MTSDELDRLEATVRGANPVPHSAGLSDSAEAAAVTLLIREATKRDCPDLLPLPAADLPSATQLEFRERSRAMDTMKRTEVHEPKRPPRWRAAAIAIAAVIVVFAVVAVGLLITRGDDDLVSVADDDPASVADTVPTITFDGETASYSGPTTFEDNQITFRLENNSDSVRAAFGWNVMNDETITLEEEIAYMETHRGDNYSIPPWVEDYNQIDFYVPPNTVVEESDPETLPTGKCLLYVWDARNRILYPAAHITVGTG